METYHLEAQAMNEEETYCLQALSIKKIEIYQSSAIGAKQEDIPYSDTKYKKGGILYWVSSYKTNGNTQA